MSLPLASVANEPSKRPPDDGIKRRFREVPNPKPGPSAGDPDGSLTDKQRAFVLAYRANPNGTQAAISAGYAARSADIQSVKLLKLSKVRKAIADGLRERSERMDVDADWVLQELIDLHRLARGAGNLYVAKSCLDSIGKHIDVGAFTERSGESAVYDALEYVLERRQRLLQAGAGGGPGPGADSSEFGPETVIDVPPGGGASGGGGNGSGTQGA
jgi:hypothetical protein